MAATYRVFVRAFTDFLTVAIHTILYEREIYPQASFITARKYDFAVRQSRHPKVCAWINDAVDAVEAELIKGEMERVAVVIHNKQHAPVERFVFDVSQFPSVPAAEADVPLQSALALDGADIPILPMVDLEQQLRATMSRLSNCSSGLQALPSGCTFTVALELKRQTHPPIDYPQHWVPTEPTRNDDETGFAAAPINKTTPIRTVRAGEMIFETWIEQVVPGRVLHASVEDSFDAGNS